MSRTPIEKELVMDAILTEIARRTLGMVTLEARKVDALDFHEVAVWSVKAALIAAYQAGECAGRAASKTKEP